MSFLFPNKCKVVPSKITFTEPTKPALKSNESLPTAPGENQKNKKQKTIDTDTASSAADISPASTNLTNNPNTMETEVIPSVSKSTDWSEDAMTLDTTKPNESRDFENSLLTLNNPAAEAASSNQLGITTAIGNSDNTRTNEIDFIQVPRITKYFATIPADKIDGNRPDLQIVNLQKLFTALPGFLGAKSFYAKKELAIYFDNEYNLEKAIEHDAKKHNISSPRFAIANSKQARIAEADRSIRVTNIPLDTKSDVIRYYFEKYGKITKFSMNTYNE
jgi:hypothetical protein